MQILNGIAARSFFQRFPYSVFLVLAYVLCSPKVALGQVTPSPYSPTTVGIDPYGSYSTTPDQINQGDLGLHIDIPLYAHKSQRTGAPGVSVHLIYDSSYLDTDNFSDKFDNNGQNNLTLFPNVGWRLQIGTTNDNLVLQSINNQNCTRGEQGCTPVYDASYTWQDQSGYSHQFGIFQSTAHYPTNVNAYSTDGMGYLLTVDGAGHTAVTSPSGTALLEYEDVVSEDDANGNVISPQPSGCPVGGCEDPNGMNGLTSGPETFADTSNVSVQLSGGGYPSTYPTPPSYRNPLYIKYIDTNGNTQTIEITYAMYYVVPISYQFQTSSPYYNPSLRYLTGLVDSVIFPDGTAYHFTYQTSSFLSGTPDGQIASMQLPTGATITYQNTWAPSESCDDPIYGASSIGEMAQVVRTTPDGPTTYSRTIDSWAPLTGCSSITPATSTTQITHADLSSESIQFVQVQVGVENLQTYDCPGGTSLNDSECYSPVNHNIETAHSWYSPSQSLLKSTMKCYNGASGNCATTSISLPITKVATTTTLDSGQTSENVEMLNALALPTEVDEYDFGAGSPTRKTVTQYASLGNNINDRPSSVTVYDANGNQASSTTYGYDEYSLNPTSGLSGHVAVSGSRGNTTSKHVWLNTTGGTIDTHTKYDDAGEVVSAEDANTNWTNYTYDSTTDTCLMNTYPPTPPSGVSNATSATCDPNTGLIASETDPNSVVTQYSYDLMLRPSGTEVIAPGGAVAAQTTRTYSGSSLPETITTTVTASPDPNEVSTVTLDGLGRAVTAVAPNGARTDTTYNSMGYVQSVSNSYFTTGDPTYGITSYLYDGLGRKVDQCQPDNSSTPSTTCSPAASYQSWSYSGNCVTSRNEDGNQWEQCTDALGRLTKVFEPNGTSQSPSMETDYSYDALNNLSSVTQWGGATGSPGARVRSFTYDSASRLLCASNPENSSAACPTTATSTYTPGTTGYSYDGNGNVILKTSPAVNAQSGAQTLGYCYDDLNRLTFKFYSGTFSCTSPSGYADAYSYDSSTVPGTMYAVGRVTDERSYIGGTLISERVPYAYDALGDLIGEEQIPYSPGGTAYQFLYGYDMAGNEICANNGFASVNASSTCSNFTALGSTVAWQYSYDAGGDLSGVVAGTQPPSFNVPTTLLQANGTSPAAYDPMGHLVNAQLGVTTGSQTPTIQLARQYDNRGRMTSEYDGSLYSYSIPAGGYDHASNLESLSDSVMGTWNFGYDTLNRLTAAQNTAVTSVSSQFQGMYGCWTYDAFGNRLLEAFSTATSLPCANGANDNIQATVTTPAANNQVSGLNYDGAGDVLSDGYNSYLYDPEGHLCAVAYPNGSGGTLYEQYLYNAAGLRVGAMAAASLSCGVPGSSPTTQYLLGLSGEQVTELGGGSVEHTNVFASGKLLATYDFVNGGLHFSLADPLGTKRVQVNAPIGLAGEAELNCLSFPFGNDVGNTRVPDCVQVGSGGVDSTEHHFTGKERDTESGNDYFGARYYSGNIGRFSIPDWSDAPDPVPYADIENPQSLNLYSYAENNPLSRFDLDGHQCDGLTEEIEITLDDTTGDPKTTYGQQPPCFNIDWNGLVTGISNTTQRLSNVAQHTLNAFSQWVNAPRDMGCMARFATTGAGAGAFAGGILGGVGGGAVGTLAEPGGGTVALGWGGAAWGATEGSGLGGSAGTAFGFAVCRTGGSSGSKGSPEKFNPRDPVHRQMTGDRIISQFKKGSIRTQFPAEYLSKTFNQIDQEASQGVDSAQTARKLLTDGRFNK